MYAICVWNSEYTACVAVAMYMYYACEHVSLSCVFVITREF